MKWPLSSICCAILSAGTAGAAVAGSEQSSARQPIAGLSTAFGAESARPDVSALQRQVEDTERAFAKTMADRNHSAFMSFLSDEAVFMSGPAALRGKQQVAQA